MIKNLLVGAALLAAIPVQAGLSTNEVITLAWDYPAADITPDLSFKVYHSETAKAPLVEWRVLTQVAGTNLTATLQVVPGRHYFYVTATNWWGESDPSNVASTPAPPRSGTLVIRRGN